MSSQRPKGTLGLNREQVVLTTVPKPMTRLLAHGIHGLKGLCGGEKPFLTLGAQNSIWQGWDNLKS